MRRIGDYNIIFDHPNRTIIKGTEISTKNMILHSTVTTRQIVQFAVQNTTGQTFKDMYKKLNFVFCFSFDFFLIFTFLNNANKPKDCVRICFCFEFNIFIVGRKDMSRSEW